VEVFTFKAPGDNHVNVNYFNHSVYLAFATIILASMFAPLKNVVKRFFILPMRDYMFKSLQGHIWIISMAILNYLIMNYNFFDTENRFFLSALTEISYCIMLFSMANFLVLMIISKISETYHWVWKKLESQIPRTEETFRKYEFLHAKRLSSGLTAKEKISIKITKTKLEYYLLRQQFIIPSFLPKLADMYLRHDFNFAEYLTVCYSKRLYQIFKFRFTILAPILVTLSIFLFIKYLVPFEYEPIIMLQFIPCYLLLNLVLLIHVRQIFGQLQISFSSPYEIDLAPFQVTRQPWGNSVQIKFPNYLCKSFHEYSESDKKLQSSPWWGWFARRNLHEQLFILGSPRLLRFFVSSLFYSQIFFIVFFMTYYLTELDDPVEIVLGLVYSSISLLIIFVVFPEIVKFSTLSTCVEMMKQKKTTRKVVVRQKEEVRSAFTALYGMLKYVRRVDESQGQDMLECPSLRGVVIELVKEAFRSCEISENRLSVGSFLQFLRQIGEKMTKEEALLFLNQILKEDEDITLEKVLGGIDQVAVDVKENPAIISYKVLSNYINMKQVSIPELKKFLRNSGMLSESQVKLIINEVFALFFSFIDSK
jgi:hypothetical protein